MWRIPARSNGGRNRVSKGGTFLVPTGGWDAASSLADMKPDRAIVLDNWFPRPDSVEARRGHRFHGHLDGVSDPVESLLIYQGRTVATSKMFAAIGASIYDATSGGDFPAASVSSLTNARWRGVNFTTAGGHFLFIVNGADSARSFDGTSWATPSITVVSSADFVNVNVHKNRLWFIMKESMNAAYLPTSAIAGAGTLFPLGAVMSKGGHLVAMGTWTQDAGAGPDDYAVFVSSRGQVAVYQGIDPASATTWSLIGVFDLGDPIGFKCFTKVGGDLALINIDGILPLSKALVTDRGAADRVSITANIDNAFNTAARLYRNNFGWELTAYPRGTYALVNVPIQENALQDQYVMNTLTGAWCRFRGQNANCWATFGDALYFGGNDGEVFLADTGSLDDHLTITCTGQTAYHYFKSVGRLKNWKMLQPLVTTDSDATPAVGISTDFKANESIGTPSSAILPGGIWDVSFWDQAFFGTAELNTANWTVVSGLGQCASVHFRIVIGGDPVATGGWGIGEWGTLLWGSSQTDEVVARINAFNTVYEMGEFM